MSDERLRDEVELLLYAILPLVPVEGGWGAGYRVAGRIDPTLRATPEEWATAAYHFTEVHRLLTVGEDR